MDKNLINIRNYDLYYCDKDFITIRYKNGNYMDITKKEFEKWLYKNEISNKLYKDLEKNILKGVYEY